MASHSSILAWRNSRTEKPDSQAPLSLGFSRQEYWSGLPFPPPGDLPDSGIESTSPASCILGGFLTTEPSGKPLHPLYALQTTLILNFQAVPFFQLTTEKK